MGFILSKVAGFVSPYALKILPYVLVVALVGGWFVAHKLSVARLATAQATIAADQVQISNLAEVNKENQAAYAELQAHQAANEAAIVALARSAARHQADTDRIDQAIDSAPAAAVLTSTFDALRALQNPSLGK